jgi:RNA polymerase sigma factor (TIGR02999 family)
MEPLAEEVTQLLRAWSSGDEAALKKLIPLVYNELHCIAKRYMAQQLVGNTLQTTALVNEAYTRLIGQQQIVWLNRAHFFAVCARIMRGILVDHFRRRRQVPLDEAVLVSPERDVNLLALDDALSKLAALDARKSQVVEMRFFGGMTEEEIAKVLGVSLVTVKREWKRARAWLYRELGRETTA